MSNNNIYIDNYTNFDDNYNKEYDSDIEHNEFESLSKSSSNSNFYLDNLPLNLRGRAEWWELKQQDIKILDIISYGSCGIVYKSIWRKLTCACKIVKNINNELDINDLKNELSIISHLRHPNLVLFLGAVTINDPLLLLYEYLPNNSIEKYYQNNNFPKPKIMYKWLTQLTQAIYFLHNCYYPVMHRDIKPSNILLTESLNIKITDFGLSKTLKSKNDIYKMSGCTGTLRYMAPEILLNNNYDLKIDIYSLSLNFWFIYTGKIPFKNVQNYESLSYMITHYIRPDISKFYCSKLADIINNMWCHEPELRFNITKVLDSINTINYNELFPKYNLFCLNII